MGRRHARVLRGLPDRFDLVGVFDAERAVAEDVARLVRQVRIETVEAGDAVG